MKILVLDESSSQILFHYGFSPWTCQVENKVIQLVTPIQASQRVLQDELGSQVQEIQLGANNILISCHSFGDRRYTLLLLATATEEANTSNRTSGSHVQIKALREVVCQFIHVLCGPCWHRLKTTANINETLQKCIDLLLLQTRYTVVQPKIVFMESF